MTKDYYRFNNFKNGSIFSNPSPIYIFLGDGHACFISEIVFIKQQMRFGESCNNSAPLLPGLTVSQGGRHWSRWLFFSVGSSW